MKCPSCGETMTVTSKHAEHDDSVMLTMWCVHQSFSQEEVRDTDCKLNGSFMISVDNISQWLMCDNNMRITSVEVTA